MKDSEEIRKKIEAEFDKPDYIVFKNTGYVVKKGNPIGGIAHLDAMLWTGILMGYSKAVETEIKELKNVKSKFVEGISKAYKVATQVDEELANYLLELLD